MPFDKYNDSMLIDRYLSINLGTNPLNPESIY